MDKLTRIRRLAEYGIVSAQNYGRLSVRVSKISTTAAALAVMFESGFPILFRNERVGEHGKIFNTLKFRTMYQKYCIGKQFADHAHALEYEKKLIAERSDKQGPVYKIKEDPRITHVGRFLRRTQHYFQIRGRPIRSPHHERGSAHDRRRAAH